MKGNSIKEHLETESRLDLARKLVKVGINSMIDVSDGVASEVKHICKESKVGAVIYADKIPISKNTMNDSKKLNKSAVNSFSKAQEPKQFVLINDTACNHGYCDSMYNGLLNAFNYLVNSKWKSEI